MNGLMLDRSRLYGYGELTPSAYNAVLGSLLAYGLLANVLICYFLRDIVYYVSGAFWGGFLIAYIVCVLLSVALSSSSSAIVNFIGYNLLVLPIGMLVTLSVSSVSPRTVEAALLGTGLFVVLMLAAAWLKPEFFLSLGSTLGISLLITIVAEVILSLLGFATGTLDYVVIAIFSLYLGYDWARANQCAPTLRNAILSATQIYLDIINIFIRLLSILSRRQRR